MPGLVTGIHALRLCSQGVGGRDTSKRSDAVGPKSKARGASEMSVLVTFDREPGWRAR